MFPKNDEIDCYERFTVLMSLYCKENPKALNESLSSLNSQTVKPDEIIIVYDGPIPQSLDEVITKWLDILPIKIVKLPYNKGLGEALNYGMKFCSHELIARMDTDDICRNTRFEKQLLYMNLHRDVTVIGSGVEEFDEEMINSLGIRFTKEKHIDIVEYARVKNPFNHMTVMFRKSHIQAVGGYKKHMLMEDYNLWLRVLNEGYKSYNIPEILVNVRAGANMISRRKGYDYILSEFQLYKLKKELSFLGGINGVFVFLMRAVPRVLPNFILAWVYKFNRK